MYLADVGAEVVKIEQPSGGDTSRTLYDPLLGGDSAVFLTVNRNKKSLALDLAHPDGRALFGRLVESADVVIEKHDVLCAPVNRYADLRTDPQVIASGMLVSEDHPRAGRLTTLDTPIRFSRTPGGIRTHAPALGEDTDAVLRAAGVEAGEIARLRSLGALR